MKLTVLFNRATRTGALIGCCSLMLSACQSGPQATEPVATGPAATGPAPTQPAAGPVAAQASGKQWVWWRGVNLAGAEFAPNALPGILGYDYQFPNQPEVDYFARKGMNIIRFPVLWERLQPRLNADFEAAEIGRVDGFIRSATASGAQVILDPHNYARYRGALIGSGAVPNAAFADLWRRLSLRYKGNNKVVFGLMNEPHDLPTAQWVSAANAAIAAIRSAGANNLILVPGNRYSGAWTWNEADSFGESNAQAMLKIKDPNNWLWFEAHQYMDVFGEGKYDECVSPTVGSERLRPFTEWLRANGKKGFLGEFSSGLNAQCDRALDDMVRHMEDNGDVWRGWTYWAAGPIWNETVTLEPRNGQDARQIPVLQKFLPRPAGQ